jgi:CHAD domain-containing protein
MTSARRHARPATGIREHALSQTATLLGRFAFEVNRASKGLDPDAVHDLRVSIRRFRQCLRVFEQFLPDKRPKRIRRRLKEILDLAAEIRNRDIALALFTEAGAPGSPLLAGIAEERDRAEQALADALRRWRRRDFSQKWRTQLGL